MEQPSQSKPADEGEVPFPRIREVPFVAPLRWLSRGLDDFKACPGPGLFYGSCFALMGFLLSFVFRHAYQYTSALTSGYLLLAPFLAIGLYEVSRRREQGLPCSLHPTLTAWRHNAGSIGVFSLVLIVIFLVWARASLVVFALFYTSEMPSVSGFLGQLLSLENIEFLSAYFVVGLVFASIVFAVGVISIPLMMDRGQDTVTAMVASALALVRNFPTLAFWALLIVALTALGFATLFFGLILTAPLLGHATWHAYRDLVEPAPAA